MKNKLSFSTSKNLYMSEVLGLKHYLCPEPVFALRSLKGGMGCSVLNVVFKPLSEDQNHLLKKIMSSVDIIDFSCLEVKNPALLGQIFRFEEDRPADLVCFFGGEREVQKELIKKGREIVQQGGEPLKGFTKTTQREQEIEQETKQRRTTEGQTWFFIQTVGLRELDGDSIPIRENKMALWAKLQRWKGLNLS